MPGIVQAAANAAIASSVTVTLGAGTTAGNTLVALTGDAADTTNGTISGITLGGSADNWALRASHNTGGHADVEGWADPSCAGTQTSVVVSTTGGTGDRLFAWILEFSGLSGTLDVSSGGDNSFAAAWTSGITGATAQASEVAFGVTCGASSGTPGLAGPASPWVNETQQTLSGSSHTKCALAGYQILSAAGTQEYAGTASPTNTNDTLVFTLKAAAAAHTATASLTVTPSFTAARLRAASRTASLTVSPAFTAARTAARFRTASLPVTPGFTAAGTRGHYRAASLAPGPSFTTARVHAAVRTAALAPAPSFTAGRVQGHARGAALSPSPSFTAHGTRNATGPVIFSLTGPSRLRWTVLRARNSDGAGMALQMASTSTDDVQVLIQELVNGVAADPTANACAMAFVAMPQYGPAAAPAAGAASWNAATWETDTAGGAAQYWISCLVGPQNSGVVLTAAAYQVFVKVTTGSSVPILPGPALLIT